MFIKYLKKLHLRYLLRYIKSHDNAPYTMEIIKQDILFLLKYIEINNITQLSIGERSRYTFRCDYTTIEELNKRLAGLIISIKTCSILTQEQLTYYSRSTNLEMFFINRSNEYVNITIEWNKFKKFTIELVDLINGSDNKLSEYYTRVLRDNNAGIRTLLVEIANAISS